MDAEALLADTPATRLPVADVPAIRSALQQEVLALDEGQLLRDACRLWHDLKRDAWRLALMLHRIDAQRLYCPHDSLTAWGRAELGKDSSAIAKYRQAAAWVLSIEDEHERDAIMAATPPAVCAEAGLHRLSKHDPEEAVRLGRAGKTQVALRDAVNVRLADREHRDTGGLRNLHFTAISTEAHRAVLRAMHRARFLMESPHPTDSELLQLIAADFLAGMPIQPETATRVGEAVVSWRLPDGPDADASLEQIIEAGEGAIDAGRVRCAECGSSNGNGLEGHHSAPKSHQGHESPIVFLCRAQHQDVTENREMSWKDHVRRWMARDDMKWFHDAFTVWLAGRSLEGI